MQRFEDLTFEVLGAVTVQSCLQSTIVDSRNMPRRLARHRLEKPCVRKCLSGGHRCTHMYISPLTLTECNRRLSALTKKRTGKVTTYLQALVSACQAPASRRFAQTRCARPDSYFERSSGIRRLCYRQIPAHFPLALWLRSILFSPSGRRLHGVLALAIRTTQVTNPSHFPRRFRCTPPPPAQRIAPAVLSAIPIPPPTLILLARRSLHLPIRHGSQSKPVARGRLGPRPLCRVAAAARLQARQAAQHARREALRDDGVLFRQP